MKIYAAKQVGYVSYFVNDLAILYQILESGRIKQSKNIEYNPRTGQKEYYVSLSRNWVAAAKRNNKRWRYGVLLDGNVLSERYHIEPFSYVGSNLNRNLQLRIKSLTAYDDNTYKLALVNWPTIYIKKNIYDYIESEILSMSDDFNISHKLIIQDEGRRIIDGHKIVKKYTYNVKHGDGGAILKSDVPSEIKTQLLKGPQTNEYEERIWSAFEYINIANAICGIILPESDIDTFNDSSDSLLCDIRELCDEKLQSYKVLVY